MSEPPVRFVTTDGFGIIPGVLGRSEYEGVAAALGEPSGAGRRGLLAVADVAGLARSEKLLGLVRPHLDSEPFPICALYFQKLPEVNWLVPWHQDLTIAVRARVEVPGFGPWSTKEGVPHVQPPVALRERMLAVRLHLDDADEVNGALRVLPGTHRLGRLSPERIRALRAERAEVTCCAAAGDALLMRPLLLHASGRATGARSRRVLHIEYAACSLPGGLTWYEDETLSNAASLETVAGGPKRPSSAENVSNAHAVP
jgi:hypothetical protein